MISNEPESLHFMVVTASIVAGRTEIEVDAFDAVVTYLFHVSITYVTGVNKDTCSKEDKRLVSTLII